MGRIIGLVGFIGAGKSTVASYLSEKGYTQLNFGGNLKDIVSVAFGWDRELLEGVTYESRIWRETVDQWWSERLGIPGLTPRWILQHWGTEVIRKSFHGDFWIASLEYKILSQLSRLDGNIVISDVRFPNEIQALKKLSGEIFWVRKDLPEWYDTAYYEGSTQMKVKYPEVHESEYSWISCGKDGLYDGILHNIGSKKYLYDQIDVLIK